MRDIAWAAAAPIALSLYLFGTSAALLLAAGAAAGAAAGVSGAGPVRERAGAAAAAALRGVVLALLLPAETPLWRAALGAAAAGGLPRLLPRLPSVAFALLLLLLLSVGLGGAPREAAASPPRPPFGLRGGAEAAPRPTPLAWIRLGGADAAAEESRGHAAAALAGFRPEPIGTAAAAGPLAALGFLLARRRLPWRLALSSLLSFVLVCGAAHVADPATHAPPLFHLLSGSFLLLLALSAADPVPPAGLEAACGVLFGVGTGLWRAVGPTPDGAAAALVGATSATMLAGLRRRRAERPPEAAA